MDQKISEKLRGETQDQLIRRINLLALSLKTLVRHDALEMILHNADLDRIMTNAINQLKKNGFTA